MSLKDEIRKHKNVAVFARNHRRYLEGAEKRNSVSPEQFTTFRSAISWASASFAIAISEHGEIPIYFSPNRSDKRIEYEARLNKILLDPESHPDEKMEMLASELESTSQEGLWEKDKNPVKTLYRINRCRLLDNPMHITDLKKLSDGRRISENYGYSYAVVYARKTLPPVAKKLYPDEVREPAKYAEGATKRVSVNIYERNTTARKDCIDYYGYNCSVCGLNFHKKYGEIGEDFIHVHHLIPLSQIGGDYKVDPIKDLRPVCPNCHAMLHRQDPYLSIEALQTKLKKH